MNAKNSSKANKSKHFGPDEIPNGILKKMGTITDSDLL